MKMNLLTTDADTDNEVMNMIDLSLTFEPENNLFRLNGVLVSLHCHYFNCGLLKALEEIPYIDAIKIYREEVAGQFYLNFKKLVSRSRKNAPPEDLLKDAAEIYRFLGYGRLDFQEITQRGGVVLSDSSYFVVGWLARYGRRSSPVCHFTSGFIAGIMAAVYDTEPDHYEVKETGCMMLGADACRFEVSER